MRAMALTLRGVQAADYEGWVQLWHGYQQFYGVAIPTQTTSVTWQRLLDPAEPMFGALAITEGRSVGLVHYIIHRSCWTIGDYCYLQDLFVSGDCRGKGVGRSLIEYVYEAAKAASCSRVYWLTHETNSDAMLLYERIAERSGFLQYRKILG